MSGEEFGEELYQEYLYFEYKDECELLKKENERLHSIIKEVREYIEQFEDAYKNFYPYVDTRHFDFKKVKEILDKGE